MRIACHLVKFICSKKWKPLITIPIPKAFYFTIFSFE
ncbi:hypothetical protein PanWU01x14_050160 [Parasponia andersonii]|uniref:Uncharacterized protein n=1 Tax=Parasponia andersonii TaxID=3476 RepID=A0A2P5DMU1_PARAD|nr:hypothetical protein PanWU01x14_050160 [Parasponia andersonii]